MHVKMINQYYNIINQKCTKVNTQLLIKIKSKKGYFLWEKGIESLPETSPRNLESPVHCLYDPQ